MEPDDVWSFFPPKKRRKLILGERKKRKYFEVWQLLWKQTLKVHFMRAISICKISPFFDKNIIINLPPSSSTWWFIVLPDRLHLLSSVCSTLELSSTYLGLTSLCFLCCVIVLADLSSWTLSHDDVQFKSVAPEEEIKGVLKKLPDHGGSTVASVLWRE